MACPRLTVWPERTRTAARNPIVIRMPSALCTTTNRESPTIPAKVTTPSAGETTIAPGTVPISIPRFPGPYGVVGGRHGSTIGPRTGVVRFTVTGGYVGGGRVVGAATVVGAARAVVTATGGTTVLVTPVTTVTTVFGATVEVATGAPMVATAEDVVDRRGDVRPGAPAAGSAEPVPAKPSTTSKTATSEPARRLRCC